MEKLLLQNQLVIMEALLYESKSVNAINRLKEQIRFTRQVIENLK